MHSKNSTYMWNSNARAYILELDGRFERHTFERRSDAIAERWKGRRWPPPPAGPVHPLG